MTRKTYVYDPTTGEMVEGHSPSRVDGHSGDGWRFSDRLYSASPFVGVDGTVINSKKSHRAYMKKHGLTTMDDFKGVWSEKRKEREAFYSGKPYDSASRKRDLIESIRKLGGDI
jgi:hypothetical protein